MTATAATLPRLIVAGERRHGVVRYARELAEAVGARVGADLSLGDGEPTDGDATRDAAGPVHLHFTDRIWGASPEEAAERVTRIAARVPVTVTLHDLPQASDGPAALPRRIAAYRRVALAARGVVCSSGHEAALLRDVVRPGPTVEAVVIPLPVDVRAPASRRAPTDDEVALLGFVYPGKGHVEAIEAVAALGAAGRPSAAGLGVTALGRASAGHEHELARMSAGAAALGVRFAVTGYLDDVTLLARCRRAGVPVAAHQHVSASGSVVAWVAAGRRPLVLETRYAREMAALRPGTLALYAPGDLAGAIDRARRAPASTWWAADATTGPGSREAAAAHIAWWTSGVAW